MFIEGGEEEAYKNSREYKGSSSGNKSYLVHDIIYVCSNISLLDIDNMMYFPIIQWDHNMRMRSRWRDDFKF